MKKLTLLFPVVVILFWQSCQKETVTKSEEAVQTETSAYTVPLSFGELTSRSSCPWTVIPAGSVDMLADAIASTCDDGVIYLLAGMHTENVGLTITKPVKIIGEAGAVLKIKSDLSVAPPADCSRCTQPCIS